MSSGNAARKSSDISGCSAGSVSCFEGCSLLLLAVGGRARTKLCVRVMLPDVFVGGRPRRFLLGIGGFMILEGLEDRGRAASAEDVEGWGVLSLVDWP